MEWKKKNNGILTPDMIADGERIKLLEEPYESGSFTNVKVELPDGSHKLGSISDISGDRLSEVWGSDMSKWVGREVQVSIRVGKNSGKPYIVLLPTEDGGAVVAPKETDGRIFDANGNEIAF